MMHRLFQASLRMGRSMRMQPLFRSVILRRQFSTANSDLNVHLVALKCSTDALLGNNSDQSSRALVQQLSDLFAALPEAEVSDIGQLRDLFESCMRSVHALGVAPMTDATQAAALHHTMLEYCSASSQFEKASLIASADYFRSLTTVVQALLSNSALRDEAFAQNKGEADSLLKRVWSNFEQLVATRSSNLAVDGVAFQDQQDFCLFVSGFVRILLASPNTSARKTAISVIQQYLVSDAPEKPSPTKYSSFREVRFATGFNMLGVIHYSSGNVAEASKEFLRALDVCHHVQELEVSDDVKQPFQVAPVVEEPRPSSDSFLSRLVKRIFPPAAQAVQQSIDNEFDEIRRAQDQVVDRMLGLSNKSGSASSASSGRRHMSTQARNMSSQAAPDIAIAHQIIEFAPLFRVMSLEPYLDSILAGRSLRTAFSAATADSSSSAGTQATVASRNLPQIFSSPSLSLPHDSSDAQETASVALNTSLHESLCNLLSLFQHEKNPLSAKIAAELIKFHIRQAPLAHAKGFNTSYFSQQTSDLLQAMSSISEAKMIELKASTAFMDAIQLSSVPEASLQPLADLCVDLAQRLYDAPHVAAPFASKAVDIQANCKSAVSLSTTTRKNLLLRFLLGAKEFEKAKKLATEIQDDFKSLSHTDVEVAFVRLASLNNAGIVHTELRNATQAADAFQQCKSLIQTLKSATDKSKIPSAVDSASFVDSLDLIALMIRSNEVCLAFETGKLVDGDEVISELLAIETLPTYLRILFMSNSAALMHRAKMWPEAAEAFGAVSKLQVDMFGADSIAAATAARWQADCLVAMHRWTDAETVLKSCMPRLFGRIPKQKLIPSYLQLLNILANSGKMSEADELASHLKLSSLKRVAKKAPSADKE